MRRITRASLIAALCLPGALPHPVTAEPPPPPLVEASVIVATNKADPQVDGRVAAFSGDLARVFGYNSFEVIGSDSRRLHDPSEQWLIPSRQFFLKLFGRPDEGALRLYTELYEGKNLLLGIEAELAPGKPLFIRGPQWGAGQVIIALLLTPPDQPPAPLDAPADGRAAGYR